MTELNGRPAERDEVKMLGLTNYGHFTSMLVEDHCVRGLSLHLERLVRDCRRLFDTELDSDMVRHYVRQRLDGTSQPIVVRVTVFDPELGLGQPGADAQPSILVTTRPAPNGPLPGLNLQSVVYRRDLPQVKHVGLFGSLWHRRSAQRDGFDDAVFTDDEGNIFEAATANVGFIAGERIVWPDAEVLAGVTMVLLDQAHDGAVTRTPVNLSQLPGVDAAFATSSVIGVRPISMVDGTSFAKDHPLLDRLREEYEAIAPEPF